MSEKVFWLERLLPLLLDDAAREVIKPSFTGVPTDDELLTLGYRWPVKRFPDGRICAIMSINFMTDALVVGIHPWGHADAFYYRADGSATAALDAWNGEGEPAGWSRNPSTGRRRTDGDPAKEYFQP